MIKSQEKNKCFIKQYVLDFNNDTFDSWMESIKDQLKENNIIGYLFTKIKSKIGLDGNILNVYYIKKKYYPNQISLDIFKQDWDNFVKDGKIKFQNPPIELWLDTKENWCKKLANKLSKTFNWSFDRTLSEIYLAIMKCYRKKTVYMGNLDYIAKAAKNEILLRLRANKIRLNQENDIVISLNTVIGYNEEDEELVIEDVLSEETHIIEDLEFAELKNKAISLLKTSFSDREIDQILNQKVTFLPKALYARLLTFRNKHAIKELYE